MVGLHAIKNQELLKHIQSWFDGIYSSEEFLERIKLGDHFYTVSAGEFGIDNIDGPFWLDAITPSTSGLCYKTVPSSISEFVADLFYGAKACFISKEEAASYRERLVAYSKSLYGTI